MSRGAVLSIMGLYNNDNTVLDLMSFPPGMTSKEQQIVKDNILVECAELEFLYLAPTVAKNIIGIWSRKELPYWQRVYNASKLEYNPIENYRRNESETITDDRTEEHSGTDTNLSGGTDSLARTGTDTIAKTGTDTLARTGTDAVAKTGKDSIAVDTTVNEDAGGNDRIDNNITGFDNNTLVPNTETETYYGKSLDKVTDSDQVTTYGSTDTETLNTLDTTSYGATETETLNTRDTTSYGKTETMQHGEKIEHDGTSERTVLAFGNIGVTTSQEMLTQEMEIAKIINVMNIIIESFKNRFCLMVY